MHEGIRDGFQYTKQQDPGTSGNHGAKDDRHMHGNNAEVGRRHQGANVRRTLPIAIPVIPI